MYPAAVWIYVDHLPPQDTVSVGARDSSEDPAGEAQGAAFFLRRSSIALAFITANGNSNLYYAVYWLMYYEPLFVLRVNDAKWSGRTSPSSEPALLQIEGFSSYS